VRERKEISRDMYRQADQGYLLPEYALVEEQTCLFFLEEAPQLASDFL